jgi:hypothetical protein
VAHSDGYRKNSEGRNYKENGCVAQLNSASDFGSEGYRFESCRGHFFKAKLLNINGLAFYFLGDEKVFGI